MIHMKIAQQSVRGNRVEVTNFLVISLRLAHINLITVLSQLCLHKHICMRLHNKAINSDGCRTISSMFYFDLSLINNFLHVKVFNL